jgi:tellurite methyltransferase
MKHQGKLWVQAFQEIAVKWKLEPDWRIVEYSQLLSRGLVLDLGMGNGRNALFFAKMGFEVDCIDVSTTYVKRCRERARAENLAISAQVADILSYDIQKNRYALIIASKVLQFFRKSEIEAIAEKINMGLAKHGVIYVQAFSLEEFEKIRDSMFFKLVEPNTYYHQKYHLINHFFTKDEVLSLFPKLKILYCSDCLQLLRKYKKPRYHWIIEYLGQRTR